MPIMAGEEDKDMLEWARANPDDPDAKAYLKAIEPTYDELRFGQRWNAYKNMPEDFNDFTSDYWQVATHVGEKDDELGKKVLEIARRQIFDEGKNINEIPATWGALSEENRRSVANVLRKAGVIDEMLIEQAYLTDEQREVSPLGEAVNLSQLSGIVAKQPMLSQREGDLPARYKWKSLGEQGITEGLTLEHVPLPFFSTIISWRRIGELRSAVDMLNDAAQDPTKYGEEDLMASARIVGLYDERARYEAARGSSIAKNFRDGLFDSISIMLEIGATGGLSAPVTAAGRATVAAVLKKVGVNIMSRAGRTAIRLGGALGLAGARTATVGGFRIADYYERARLQGASAGSALVGGIADTFLMQFAELSGTRLARLAKGVPGGIPGIHRVLLKLEKAADRAILGKGGGKIAGMLQKVGYHGFVGEYAEERLETALTAVFNTRDFGMTPEESNLLTRLMKVQPGLKDTITELMVLAVPAGGMATLNLAAEARIEGKQVQMADWAKRQDELNAQQDEVETRKRELDAQPPTIPVENIPDEIDLAKSEQEAVPARFKADYPADLVEEQNALVGQLHEQERTVIKLKEDQDRAFDETQKNEIAQQIRVAEKEIGALQGKVDRAGVRINAATKRARKAAEDTEQSRRSAAAESFLDTVREAKNLRPEYKKVMDSILSRFRKSKYSDEQRVKDIETVNAYEADPVGDISSKRFRAAQRRLESGNRPVLRNLPESEIRAMESIVSTIKVENDAKQAEMTELFNKQIELDQQSVEDFVKITKGEKYAPGLRGKPSGLARLRQAVGFLPAKLKYKGYTFESLLRAIVPPGSRTYQRIYDAALRADLIEMPKIVNDSTDKVNAERIRRGIDTDVWESEVLNYPLAETAVDEKGQKHDTVPMTRSEMAELYCLLRDPDRLDALKEEAAKGVKLSPHAAIALKLSKNNLRSLRTLDGLDEADRRQVVGFAEWMQENIYGENGDVGKLYIESQLAQRGYARPHREGYYPSTREKELVEKAYEEYGEATKARKAVTESKAPFVIESIFKTHGRMISALARHNTKTTLDKRFQAIFGTREGGGNAANRRVRQSIRSALPNGQSLLDNLFDRQSAWAGKEKITKESIDKVIRFFTRLGHIGALGFNLPVAAYQQFSRLTVLSHQGQDFKKFLFAASTFSPGQLAEMDAWIKQNVPWLRNRYEHGVSGIITPDTADIHVARRYGAKGGILRRILHAFHKVSMIHIQTVDRVTIDQIGVAIKLKGLSMGLSGVELDNYVRENLVQEVVATQPASDALSLTGWHTLARRHSIFKPFVMFTSPLIKQYNQIVQAAQDFELKRQTGTLNAADFGNAAYRISIPLILNSFLIYMTKYGFDKLRDAILGIEDDKELKDHLEGILGRATGNLVVSGPYIERAIKFVRNKATGKPAYDIDSNIVTDSVEKLADAMGTAFSAYGEKSPLKRSKKFNQAIGKFLRGGEIFGVPGGAVGPWYDRITNPKKFMKKRLR